MFDFTSFTENLLHVSIYFKEAAGEESILAKQINRLFNEDTNNRYYAQPLATNQMLAMNISNKFYGINHSIFVLPEDGGNSHIDPYEVFNNPNIPIDQLTSLYFSLCENEVTSTLARVRMLQPDSKDKDDFAALQFTHSMLTDDKYVFDDRGGIELNDAVNEILSRKFTLFPSDYIIKDECFIILSVRDRINRKIIDIPMIYSTNPQDKEPYRRVFVEGYNDVSYQDELFEYLCENKPTINDLVGAIKHGEDDFVISNFINTISDAAKSMDSDIEELAKSLSEDGTDVEVKTMKAGGLDEVVNMLVEQQKDRNVIYYLYNSNDPNVIKRLANISINKEFIDKTFVASTPFLPHLGNIKCIDVYSDNSKCGCSKIIFKWTDINGITGFTHQVSSGRNCSDSSTPVHLPVSLVKNPDELDEFKYLTDFDHTHIEVDGSKELLVALHLSEGNALIDIIQYDTENDSNKSHAIHPIFISSKHSSNTNVVEYESDTYVTDMDIINAYIQSTNGNLYN